MSNNQEKLNLLQYIRVDDLIESFRRADLILFLMQVFKKQNYQMFERVFEKE